MRPTPQSALALALATHRRTAHAIAYARAHRPASTALRLVAVIKAQRAH